jgi:hypothetical protein
MANSDAERAYASSVALVGSTFSRQSKSRDGLAAVRVSYVALCSISARLIPVLNTLMEDGRRTIRVDAYIMRQ